MKMNASDPDTFVEILLKDGEVPKEILNKKTRGKTILNNGTIGCKQSIRHRLWLRNS